jgi:hypothetical protein
LIHGAEFLPWTKAPVHQLFNFLATTPEAWRIVKIAKDIKTEHTFHESGAVCPGILILNSFWTLLTWCSFFVCLYILYVFVVSRHIRAGESTSHLSSSLQGCDFEARSLSFSERSAMARRSADVQMSSRCSLISYFFSVL